MHLSQVHQPSCTNKTAPTKLHQPSRRGESVPQNTQNTQNILAEKCLPQIDTDAHRLGGYGIPAIPTLPITQPNHLWKSVKSVGEYYHAGAAASAAPTKQTERVSHRTCGTHRTFWQRKPPTDRHRCAQIRRVWHPAIPTPPTKGCSCLCCTNKTDGTSARLVHFLLWQAAKPSGDKCTP